MAAQAAALDELRHSQAAHRRRVADSHAAQMAALGLEQPASQGDDMGGVMITGDVTTYPPPEPAKRSVAPAALVAALAAIAGAGGIAGVSSLQSSEPAASAQQQQQPAGDYSLRVKVTRPEMELKR